MTGTRTMTLTERGAYITLLCHQWDKGGVPGDDLVELSKILGCSLVTTRQVWTRIAHKFFRDTKGIFRNRRLEKERAKQRRFRKSQSNKGKLSAQRRNRGLTGVQPITVASRLNPSSSSSSSDVRTPPLPPADAGGARVTREERKWAKSERDRWRRDQQAAFSHRCGHQPEWQARRKGIDPGPPPARCWHDPQCDDDDLCLDRIARDRRTRRAG